jgi:hypothetical protein
MVRNQLMAFVDEPGRVSMLFDSLPNDLATRLRREINMSGIQYEMIRKSPNLAVAKAMHAAGVSYKWPGVLSDVLHHAVFRNTVLQLPAAEFNWAYPEWTFQQIFNNDAEVAAIDEWLNWLMFTVEVDAFKIVSNVGIDPRHTFNVVELDRIRRTPAFNAVTLPDRKSEPTDIFRPGFIWFVRHYGNFKAGVTTSGPRKLNVNIIDVYAQRYLKASTKEFAPFLLTLLALCPAHLTIESLPPLKMSKELLRSSIISVIRRGGSRSAILRLPSAPGEYNNRYGNAALVVGNFNFLNECSSIFGVAPSFSLEKILLPYIRVDVMPAFIDAVPISKNRDLIKMIRALPVEQRIIFLNTFQHQLLERDPSWLETINEI